MIFIELEKSNQEILICAIFALIGVIFLNSIIKNNHGEKNVSDVTTAQVVEYKKELSRLKAKWAKEDKEKILSLEKRYGDFWHLSMSESHILITRFCSVRAYLRRKVPLSKGDIVSEIYNSMLHPFSGSNPTHRPEEVILICYSCSKDVLKIIRETLSEIGINFKDLDEVTNSDIEYLETGKLPQICDNVNKFTYCCSVCGKKLCKVNQCNNCKAVIYCGIECAKIDYSSHKLVCKTIKDELTELKNQQSEGFDFEFYNSTKTLTHVMLPELLRVYKIHGVGIYKILCACYDRIPILRVHTDFVQNFKTRRRTDPDPFSEITGVGSTWVLNTSINRNSSIPDLNTWKEFYNYIRSSSSSPAALVMYHTTTIWYIVKNYLYDSDVDIEGGRHIRIHIVNAGRELDTMILYKVIAQLLPKIILTIDYISGTLDNLFEQPGMKASIFTHDQCDSSVICTVAGGNYTYDTYMGMGIPHIVAENHNSEFPKAVIELEPDPGEKRISYECYTLFAKMSTYFFYIAKSKKACDDVLRSLEPLAGDNVELISTFINPFRQPVIIKESTNNIPSWNHGFICGFKPKNREAN